MTYALNQTPMFDKCVAEYVERGDKDAIFDLHVSLDELKKQPFGNPTLQTHKMQGVRGFKRFISDSGGRKGQRIIWAQVDKEIVLLLFGEHDPVERRAERIDLNFEPRQRRIEVVERDEHVVSSYEPPADADDKPGQLFVAWTDQELSDFGFADHVVPVLRGLDTEDELLALPLSDGDERRAINLVLYGNPQGETAKRASTERRAEAEAEVTELVTDAEKEAARAVRSPASRKSVAPLTDEQLEQLLKKPIEEWMVFLHPDQGKLTQRPFSGPARVRGGAGTGKTVVALHRAKHLAATYGEQVLFTTYVKNLPPVFAKLFGRLAPDEAALVDFRTLHSVAFRLLNAGHVPFNISSNDLKPAFATAWKRAVSDDGPLAQLDLTRDYLQTEIEWVIKGRGIRSLDEYLGLARTGRGTALSAPAREEAWKLYEAYEQELERRNTIDFADLLLRALELLEQGRVHSPYRSVLIDEAQDLTEVGVRLAYLLAGEDRRDGLFLVGDGQQAVYPGGFSLGSLGIDVRGRASLLKVNYRNTREVADLAARLVADSTFDDGEDDTFAEKGDRERVLVRDGAPPTFHGFDTVEDHDLALAARIDDLADRDDTSLGDVAVLVPTNRMVREVERTINGLGLSCIRLENYEGVPDEKVKVGTYQRGKGLEFKRVLLPRLDSDGIGEAQRHGEDDATHRERLALLRNALFVAITRARDGVWGGWVGDPADLLKGTVNPM